MLVITIDELTKDHIDTITLSNPMMEIYFEPDLLISSLPLDKVEIILTYGFDITKELLDKLPSLKWIQVFQTGVEHLPLQELDNRNITLTNVSGIYGNAISEYVMSIILYYIKELPRFIENKKSHTWDRTILPEEANEKKLLILGAGIIGKAVAEKAKAFGMYVIGVNSSGESRPYFDEMYALSEMDEVLCRSDVVVSLLPVTNETYQCIGKVQFSLMKDSAYFINVGRGELIDEDALIESLKSKGLRGAALDVFQQEPLPEDHPFWEVENLIITPHLSGKTVYFYKRCIDIFLENLNRYQNKKQLAFSINLKKGY